MADNTDNNNSCPETGDITITPADMAKSADTAEELSGNTDTVTESDNGDIAEEKTNIADSDGADNSDSGTDVPSCGVSPDKYSGNENSRSVRPGEAYGYTLRTGDQQNIPLYPPTGGIHDDTDIIPVYLRRYSEDTPLKKAHAELPEKREKSTVRETVMRIFSGTLLGLGCGLLFIALYLRGFMPQLLVSLLAFICSWLISGYVNDYIRLLTAVLGGGKVLYFRIFCFRFNIDVPAEACSKRKIQIVHPFGDRALCVPPSGNEISESIYRRYFGMNITALALSVLLSLAAACIANNSAAWCVSAGFAMRLALKLFGGVSDGIPSDGTILYSLFRRLPSAEGYIKLCIIYSLMRGGVRPRDISIPPVGIYIPVRKKLFAKSRKSDTPYGSPAAESASESSEMPEPDIAAESVSDAASDETRPQSSGDIGFFGKLLLSRRSGKLAAEAMNFAAEGDELAELLEEDDTAEEQLDIPGGEDDDKDGGTSACNPYILRRYPERTDGNSPLMPDFTYLFYQKELDSLTGDKLFAYAHILIRTALDSPVYIHNDIYRELCFIYTIGHNPIAASELYRLCDKNDDLVTLRMRAWYTALVLENTDEALEICEYAFRRTERRIKYGVTHTAGRDIAEILLLERLKKEMKRGE